MITDFRLLSTSVKPKNFIDFYRSQKKMKHPRCLVIIYCLCLAGLYSPVQCLLVRPEPTRVRHLSDTPLKERLRPYLQTDKTGKACKGQTLITNIRELGMREVLSDWFVFLLSFSPSWKVYLGLTKVWAWQRSIIDRSCLSFCLNQ